MASNGNLTPAQELFAQHVGHGKSQAEAYRIAYPKSAKWKDEAVWVAASKLMANAKVSVRVKEIKAQVSQTLTISLERTLQEIARLALFDTRKLFNPDGSLKPIHELDDDAAAAIASIEVEEINVGSGEERKTIGYTRKVKVWDKNPALEKLMKHLGGYEKHNEQKANPLAELLAQLGGNVLGVAKTGEGEK